MGMAEGKPIDVLSTDREPQTEAVTQRQSPPDLGIDNAITLIYMNCFMRRRSAVIAAISGLLQD
jgi:hypothetical protein